MIRFEEDRIVLTGEASVAFVKNALCPDRDMVARREAYRPILEQNKIEIRDGCVYADIPDLDIPDKPESRQFTCAFSVDMSKTAESTVIMAVESIENVYTRSFRSDLSAQNEKTVVSYNGMSGRSKYYFLGDEPLDAA